MQGEGVRLWKQVNSLPCKNAPKQQKSMPKQKMERKGSNQKVQQKYCRKESQQIQDHSFGKIDISVIHQANSQQTEEQCLNMPNFGNWNSLQFFFNQISDTKKKTGTKLEKIPQANYSTMNQNKYKRACKIFQGILKNFNQQIENIKKTVAKEVEKSQHFISIFVNQLFKTIKQLENSIKYQKSVIGQSNNKMEKNSRIIQQLSQNKRSLQQENSDLRQKICQFCAKVKKQSYDRLFQFEKVLSENKTLKQNSFQLTSEILQLRQKLNHIERELSKKIKQNQALEHFRISRIQDLDLKIKNSSLVQSRYGSKHKEATKQKLNATPINKKNIYIENSNLKPITMSISRKVSRDSQIWQTDKDQQQRRKTFSNCHQISKIRKQDQNAENNEDSIIKKMILNQKYSLQISPQSLNRQKLYSELQKLNISEGSYGRSYNAKRSKCQANSRQFQDNKQCKNFGLMGSKLKQMKMEIEDQIKNLKSSISTTNI